MRGRIVKILFAIALQNAENVLKTQKGIAGKLSAICGKASRTYMYTEYLDFVQNRAYTRYFSGRLDAKWVEKRTV